MKSGTLSARRLAVALVSREYPPESGWGGIGTYTWNLARGLRDAGHTVTVIASSAGQGESDRSTEGLRVVRVAHGWLRFLSAARALRPVSCTTNMLVQSLVVYRALCQLDRRARFDVVEFPDFWAEGFVTTRRIFRRWPTVTRIHGYQKLIARLHGARENPEMRRQQRLETAAITGSTLILPNTKWIAKQLESDYGVPRSQQRLQYMGIDTALFRPVDAARRAEIRNNLGIADDTVLLLSCGRLEVRKGFHHLIAAVGVLQAGGLPVKLAICGREAYEGELARLETCAVDAGVRARVLFPGPVPYHELPAWYSAADVYAGASFGESPGLTYIEAMACGKPVVAIRDGGLPEVVQHGRTGILAASAEATTLAAAIHLALEPEMVAQCATSSAAYVHERFSVKAVVPDHVAHYLSAANIHATRAWPSGR